MAKNSVDVVKRMISGFEQTYNTSDELTKYLTVYSPDVHWYDHAFKICRVGRDAISGLRIAFLHCNQPFHGEIKSINALPQGAIVELVWHGKTANDIVRPDGQVAVKATGKDFDCHVCMIFEVDEVAGEITRIDEYYNKQWDDGIAEGDYFVMKGQSLKKDS